MKYKLLEKAWQIDLSKVNEGYLYNQDIVYAETRGKAKVKYSVWDYYTLFDENENFTYLNLPVIRCKEADKYEVNGKPMTKSKIEYYEKIDKREAEFDKLLKDNPNSYAYIKKRGTYYRPNCNGYTNERLAAGVYTLEKAVSECKGCDLSDNMHPVLIDIEEHNTYILKHIEDFKSRLL